jgi:sugar transferase (PEP-CTERM system associated)
MIHLFSHYFSWRLLLLSVIEAAVLFMSILLGIQLRIPAGDPTPSAYDATVFTIAMLAMMNALGLYSRQPETIKNTIQRLLVALILAFFLSSAVFYAFPGLYVGRGIFAISAVISVAGLVLVRLLFFQVSSASVLKRRIMVVGSGEASREIIAYLQGADAIRSMQFVGLYSTPDELQPEGKYRDIEHGDLLAQVETLRATEVVIAARERRGGALPLRDLLDCKLEGIRVCDSVAFFEQEKGLLRLDDLRASWMIYGDGFNQGLARDVIKRIFDIVFSLVLLVVALPVMLIAACAVWLESRGPIIYRQERVGERGRSFQILKFRSMIQSAEKSGLPQWASPRDSRITRVGRVIRATRIDELPQIFNVLLGEMSFVGPRPERPSFVTQLADQIRFYDMRHSLKPGITGWAQVRFHYGASIEDSVEKLQYDLYYVKNHSLFLDLLIILETVQVVIGRKGAR